MIQIDTHWRILVDESCYVLQAQTDETEWENKGFYSTLYKALQGYVKYQTIEVLSDKQITLTEAVTLLEGQMNTTHRELAKLKEILHE